MLIQDIIPNKDIKKTRDKSLKSFDAEKFQPKKCQNYSRRNFYYKLTNIHKTLKSLKIQKKLTASVVLFLIIFQTITGVFLPVKVSLNNLQISTNRTKAAGEVWYSTGGTWNYRKQITIDNTKVPNTDQTNFPILINRTDADWKDTSNSGKVGQSDGGDILFTSSDGSTKLSHEIEKYNNVTGEIQTWVKIPTLSSSADTVIYMYYGNASIANQWDTNSVWDTNHKMVQHLQEDPSGSAPQMTDSTSNSNDGTSSGTMTTGDQVTGKIDGSLNFDGTDDKITVSDDAVLDITDTITLSAWVNVSADIGTDLVYTAKSDSIGTISEFSRRTPITITTTGTTTPVNYQVKATVLYKSLMKTSFEDVRFNTQADGSGTYIDYWIESHTDSITTDVWLELPTGITDGNNDTVYMFYGNAGLSDGGNITDTMVFGDDFLGSSLDVSKWNSGGATTPSISNGIMTYSVGGNQLSYLETDNEYTSPSILEARINFNESGNGGFVFGIGHEDAVPRYKIMSNDGSDNRNWILNNTGYVTTNMNRMGYKILKMERVNSTYGAVYENGIELTNSPVTSNIPTTTEPLNYSLSGVDGNPYTMYTDWIFIREYIANEPTVVFGITTTLNLYSAVSDSSGNVNVFTNKKPITISHSGALTDYQTNITITYESAMQADFDDIRFVTNSGVYIPYWIESKTDSTTADVWIKSDLSDGDTTVWMYYGNNGLSSGSDGDNVFVQWHGTATSNFLDSAVTAVPFVWEGKWKRITGDDVYIGVANISTPYSDDSVCAYSNVSAASLRTRNEGAWGGDSITPIFTADTYYNTKIVASSSSLVTIYPFYNTTPETAFTSTTNIPNELMGLVLYEGAGSQGVQDWSFIRQYTATEPT
ncbi:MAG: DUF2341 domain-containing protein, partial [Candidatus Pacebacteria bacterium]|nr:DUF2341 domain-containing protein [Candidatus Paceibacterota bacterium]